jgi:hypothetical protein
MKNIAVFTGFVIIFYTAIIGPRAWAQYSGPVFSQTPVKDKFPYTLSLTSSFGLLYGYGEEMVYQFGKDT